MTVNSLSRADRLTVLTDGPAEAGKGGKGGDIRITNAEFIAAVILGTPEGAHAAIASKAGDPATGGWFPVHADQADSVPSDKNNYLNCSSFYPDKAGAFRARKSSFAACHFLMLDDLGTKVSRERLDDLPLSWLIETSPGNYQGGIILAEPITQGPEAERLLEALIEAGLCDAGAGGPLTRWARLPVAINGKPKHANPDGRPFQCRLVEWRPEKRYTPAEIVGRLQLDLRPAGRPKRTTREGSPAGIGNGAVLLPKAEENPVVRALKATSRYKESLGDGKHDITCPWVNEHTDKINTGAAYFEPDGAYPLGGFCCQHSHRDKYHIGELLKVLGVGSDEARHRAIIRVIPGDMDSVLDAAERELANRGKHYQAGGLIVSVSTDPTSGDPSIVPTSLPALTRELSVAAIWQRYDRRAEDWVSIDPPEKHTNILHAAQRFCHLPPLAGVTRQPYFRETDGCLVTQPGYDPEAQRFGVFDAGQFVIPEPTAEAAKKALALLEGLLSEFHFRDGSDKAAALAAMFTAVVRPSLPHAPAFHVQAPVIGSGKTYLCELIGAFAGPGSNAKVSYPTTSEEATKAILSLLLANPAVIEFDDMDTDWLPHGTIKRMLTSEYVTDRILGASRTATVSTRTLFLGSGNNVGPVRDLLRRVLTIHLDPRCPIPAVISYTGAPVEKVRQQRGIYVAAVLTIILAWRAAGSPRTSVSDIATFGGAWSNYCRHPLIWLGHPDPATALFGQLREDPDGEALGCLLREWHAAFGSTPTTVRRAVAAVYGNDNLLDAMQECHFVERGDVNRPRFGQFLKRNANRIIDGLEFQSAKADGRKAWRVVRTPPLPPLPASASPDGETVSGWSGTI